jgi:tetratricopeptide (TPR) repeat protein
VGGLTLLALLAGLFSRAWRGALKFTRISSADHSPHALLSSRAAFQRSFFIGVLGAWAAVMFHVLVDFDMHIFANALTLSILLAFMVGLSFTPREWGKTSFSTRPWVGWSLAGGCVALLLAGALLIPRNFHGDWLRMRAVAADEALEWDAAERCFQKAVETDPANSRAWEEYAGFLYKWAQLNIIQRDALVVRFDVACGKALKTNPLCVLMHVRRGEILDLQKHFEEAEKEYRVALDFDPINPFFNNRAGLHYRRRGMDLEAERHLKLALEYGGSDSVASENLKELKPF